MDAHRDWLLSTYGPICAYCGQTIKPETATLDHVRPRKGQKAYDRPDNLVIACRDCNSAKADMPLVSWLLQRKSRAVLLLEYGRHLSSGLQQEAFRLVDRPMLDLSANDGSPVAVGLRFRPGRPGKRR